MKIKHDLPTSEQMRAEMKRKLEAGERLGASHNGPPLPPGMVIAGSIEPPDHLRYAAMDRTVRKRRLRPLVVEGSPFVLGNRRKRISEKSCKGGHICLPGLGGKCVACSEDDDT